MMTKRALLIQSEWQTTLGLAVLGAIMLAGGALASFSRDPGDVAVARDPQQQRWDHQVAELRQSLAAGDRTRSAYRWADVYALAVAARGWEPMAVVGDLALEMSRLDHAAEPYREKARRAYLSALGRARAERSAEGAMRIAGSLEGFGEPKLAEQARRISEQLAPGQKRS